MEYIMQFLKSLKPTVKLLILFEALDIITTYIGVVLFGATELNKIFSLGGLFLYKIVAVTCVAIVIQRLPFEKDTRFVRFLITLTIVIPITCVVWNTFVLGVMTWLIYL
jgi:hypothetical protein